MKNLIALPLVILMALTIVACDGSHINGQNPADQNQTDDGLSTNDSFDSLPKTILDEESDNISVNDNDVAYNPSIDYRDYGITINEYDVDYGLYSEVALADFPLDVFIAWCLGSDGAYSVAAYHVLLDRFISNPDEILGYIILIGDNIVHDEYAKVRLCRGIAIAAISRNEFEGNVRISLPEFIDDLFVKYQSGVKFELLSSISEQYDSYLQENYG